MRNLIFTLLLLLMAGPAVLAQSQEVRSVEPAPVPSLAQVQQKAAQAVDTLDDYLARATAYYTLTAQQGYVLGSNPGLLETAVHYDNPGGNTFVTEVICFFAQKAIMGAGADSVSVFVYPAGLDSMPAGLPIASGKFSMDDADTSGFGTFIPMNSSIGAVGGFLVSVVHDLASIDDTIAIISTNVLTTGGGPDGNGEKRVRQNTAGGWMRAYDIWTIAGNNYDADALVIPIVDVTAVSVDPQAALSSFRLYRAYPNPAVNELRIPYEINATQPVSLMLIDATGRIILQEDAVEQPAGAHEWQLNTSALATGTYYYVLNVGGQVLGGKFVH